MAGRQCCCGWKSSIASDCPLLQQGNHIFTSAQCPKAFSRSTTSDNVGVITRPTLHFLASHKPHGELKQWAVPLSMCTIACTVYTH